MDRYIGLDAHSSSCTVAVVGPSGRRLQSKVLETNARVLIDFLKSVPRSRHLCLEEGTHSAWLYEELAPHAEEIVVVGVGRRRGSKSDSIDALRLAESLRVGSIERRVYKGLGEWGVLRELSRAYRMVVRDSVRVQWKDQESVSFARDCHRRSESLPRVGSQGVEEESSGDHALPDRDSLRGARCDPRAATAGRDRDALRVAPAWDFPDPGERAPGWGRFGSPSSCRWW